MGSRVADMAVPLDERGIRLDDLEAVCAIRWGSHCVVGEFGERLVIA
jgi:hypothetical protein